MVPAGRRSVRSVMSASAVTRTTSPQARGAFSAERSAAGVVAELDERVDVVDEEPVERLSADRDEVVLPQRRERTVDRDGRLVRHRVLDATDDTPRGLRPVAGVA